MSAHTIPEPSEPIAPARRNNPRRENLREVAAQWIREHPTGYALFMGFAREMAARKRAFGAKALAERVRWESSLRGSDPSYLLNNNVVAYVARQLVADAPELRPFLRFRQTKY